MATETKKITPRMIYNGYDPAERLIIRDRFCKRIGITEKAFMDRIRGETKWKSIEIEIFSEEFEIEANLIQI